MGTYNQAIEEVSNLIEYEARMSRRCHRDDADYLDQLASDIRSLKRQDTSDPLIEILTEALRHVHAILIEGGLVGFDPSKGGDWAERLYISRKMTHDAIALAEASEPTEAI